jgi:hypothetical protein
MIEGKREKKIKILSRPQKQGATNYRKPGVLRNVSIKILILRLKYLMELLRTDPSPPDL